MIKTITGIEYYLLKNSRGKYICEGGRLKQNFHKAITFDSQREAENYAKENKRRAFSVYYIERETYIDSSKHPHTRVWSDSFEKKA